ncbi:MAG: hypothetical protein QOK39_2816, partial [Acidimicrobiaceae bacterium]|nr:hypothetical protein [Acidimicrobiaceae bacterium]
MMCCLVAGPALSKGRGLPVQASLVEASRVLPPYVSATYVAQCPSSHPHPVGGEFDETSSGGLGMVALAASHPQGKRGWVVVVQNLSDQPQGYLVGVICLRASARFAYPRVTYVVDPRGTSGAIVGCPNTAPHAISGYFSVQSSADLGKGLLDNWGIYKNGKQEFGVAGVKSVSGAPIGMYGGAVCTSLQTGSSGFHSTVAPGMTEAQIAPCPRKTPVAVGGFAFAKAVADDGAIVLIAMG